MEYLPPTPTRQEASRTSSPIDFVPPPLPPSPINDTEEIKTLPMAFFKKPQRTNSFFEYFSSFFGRS